MNAQLEQKLHHFIHEMTQSGKDMNGQYWIPRAVKLLSDMDAERASTARSADVSSLIERTEAAERERDELQRQNAICANGAAAWAAKAGAAEYERDTLRAELAKLRDQFPVGHVAFYATEDDEIFKVSKLMATERDAKVCALLWEDARHKGNTIKVGTMALYAEPVPIPAPEAAGSAVVMNLSDEQIIDMWNEGDCSGRTATIVNFARALLVAAAQPVREPPSQQPVTAEQLLRVVFQRPDISGAIREWSVRDILEESGELTLNGDDFRAMAEFVAAPLNKVGSEAAE